MLDHDRLAKVCELLTSSHPAERAVAADKASAILDAAGMTWTDLVGKAFRPAYEFQQPDKASTKYGMSASVLVRELAKHKRELSEWEREFVRNLKAFGANVTLSDKQWAVVIRLAVKAGILGREQAA